MIQIDEYIENKWNSEKLLEPKKKLYCGDRCGLSNFEISNNTIINNTADSLGGCFIKDSSNVIFSNCILWNNSAQEILLEEGSSAEVLYCDIQGGWSGEGNIDEDPLFVTGPLSDYHLSPGSPCIDAGNPNSLYNDPEDPLNPGFALWPAQGTIRNDMGVYGGGGASSWLGIIEEERKPSPSNFHLSQNYPNPFNPTTVISFQLPVASFVKLEVFDICGRKVIMSGSGAIPTTVLVDGWRDAGHHEVTFDGSNLASGIYIYRLQAGDFTAVQKMVLMK